MSTRTNDVTATIADTLDHALPSADLAAVTGGGRLHGEFGVEHSVGANGKVSVQTGTYRVGRGDNLTSIARATNQSVGDLIRRNPELGKNPDLIQPGQRIVTGSSSVHE